MPRFFPLLSERTIQDVESKMELNEYPAGAALYRQGEDARGIFFVIEGQLKITAVVSSDRTALLKIAGAGEVLGLAAVLSGEPNPASAHVSKRVMAGFIRYEEFTTLLRSHPDFSEAVARSLAAESVALATETLLLRVPCQSSQRLAGTLLRLEEEGLNGNGSGTVSLQYTHAELGQLTGASRETITRLIRKFEGKGLIVANGTGITISDRLHLSDIARDN